MLAAMSSCLVLGFLLSMPEVPWMVAALLMVSLLCGCFCFSCRTRHVPTCRTPPGEGGGSKCKERGIAHPWSEAERAKRSGGLHKRSAEAWGDSLRARGAAPLSVLSTCVTKQTRDMRYRKRNPDGSSALVV